MSVNQTDASNRAEGEKLRSEIHRLYIQEDKTLEETRAEILATFGFKAWYGLLMMVDT